MTLVNKPLRPCHRAKFSSQKPPSTMLCNIVFPNLLVQESHSNIISTGRMTLNVIPDEVGPLAFCFCGCVLDFSALDGIRGPV